MIGLRPQVPLENQNFFTFFTSCAICLELWRFHCDGPRNEKRSGENSLEVFFGSKQKTSNAS